MNQEGWRKVRVLSISAIFALVPLMLLAVLAVEPIVRSLEQAQSDTDQIQHLRRLGAEKPAYEAMLIRTRAALTGHGILYAGASDELASAQLQNLLQSLVLRAGGKISSTEIEPPRAVSGLKLLGVSITFSLPPSQLGNLLSAIAIQKPYLVVRTLALRSTGAGNGRAPLNVQLGIKSFRSTA